MKIPQSVRNLYADLHPIYSELKTAVDGLIMSRKEARWHYEGRVKEEESFALKLETGRVRKMEMPEDFFACTLVVENRTRIEAAEELICNLFQFDSRRPKDRKLTHLPPHSFDFDDLRLYVRWIETPGLSQPKIKGRLFEVQIKTFLQHAWSIATHDFVYKTDDVDWSGSRIAYQVKAMLENAELSIGEAKKLTTSSMLDKIDYGCSDLRIMLEASRKRWNEDELPKDMRRFAEILWETINALHIDFNDLWAMVDEATNNGYGSKTLNLSPYGAILEALIRKRQADLFKPLGHPRCRDYVFVPLEINLPSLPAEQMARIVRPPSSPIA